MNYYRHNETKEVHAYSAESVAKAERLTVLEPLIQANEPVFVEAQNNLQQALSALNESRNQLEVAIENEASEEEIISIQETLNLNEKAFNDANDSFKAAESNYQPFKDEYDAVLPVFFDIREKLKVMTKMTQKEIEKHLNPPISKEQYIAEAESKKQMLLSEAADEIAPLQDAVDLDIATDEEVALLTEWKKYRVLLNRVDTSLAPDIKWPQKP